MAMKDLFCLVNAFMNRAKSDDNSGNQMQVENSDDTRVLPGSSDALDKNGFMLASLEPFQNLLPNLYGADLDTQKLLHKALYTAGVSAALSLQKFICEAPSNKSSAESNPSASAMSMLSIQSDDAWKWKEIFNQLGKFIALDDSGETFNILSNAGMEDFIRNSDCGKSLMKMVSNEVAAAALAAFASATYRRPPTKHIESLMQNAHETTAQASIEDDVSNENSRRSLSTGKNDHSKCPVCNLHKSQSNSSSVVALAGEDGTDDDLCYCETESEDMEDEDSLFRYVCAAGHDDLAKLLVSVRKSAEFTQRSDSTPLMEACCSGHTSLVKILIEAGANVNATSGTQNTALIYACASGHIDCARQLLQSGCDIDIRNESGHCALMEAANAGELEIIKFLIGLGAKPNVFVDNSDLRESPLTLAAYKGHVKVVEYLISIMPQTNDREEEFYTALMEAAMDGHVPVAKVLLEAGAKVSMPTESFESPLTLAACGGHVELVSLLLDHGADVEEPNDEGYTPLMEASREGHKTVVELLLNRGANVNAKIDDGLETPLTLASSGGFRDVVELLIARGGDLTVGERTPLYEATQEGHIDVAQLIIEHLRKTYSQKEIQLDLNNSFVCAAETNNIALCNILLENGAQINCLSKENRTPLMEASKQNNLQIVELLVKKGADVNKIAPNNECTALSLASQNGYLDVLRFLIENGGDPHIQLKDSYTCLLEASKNGHTQCVELLLASGSLQKPMGTVTRRHSSGTKLHPGSTTSTVVVEKTTVVSGGKELTEINAQIETSDSSKKPQLVAAFSTISSSIQNEPDIHRLQNNQSILNRKRDLTDEEVRSFIQKFRQAFPSEPLDIEALLSGSNEQTLRNIYTAVAMIEKRGNLSPLECSSTNELNIDDKLRVKPGISSIMSASCNEKQEFKSTKKRSLSLKESGNSTTSRSKTGTSVQTPQPPSQPPPKQPPPGVTQHHHQHPCCRLSPAVPNIGSSKKQTAKRSAVEGSGANKGTDSSAHSEANHDTALTLACVGGHSSVVKLLLTQGAELEHRDKKGFTPLILAASGGHTEVCKLLLEAGCIVDACADRTKDTALSMACSGGRKEVAELLIKHGANKEHRNLSDYTPLSLAASGGYTDIIQLLLNTGAEINSRTGSKLGISPLMLAAMNGHEQATQMLLENGSDINAQIETNRNTALTLACFQGRSEVAKLLIKCGANVDHRAKTGLTPLMEAATGGYVEVGELLIQSGADVNATPVPSSRDTALTIAADKGHHAFAQMLLHADAQINARNKKGCSALWLAANGGHLEAVQILVKHNADTEAQDNRKLTPLMVAFRKGHVKVVKFLVRHVSQFPNDQECLRYVATLTDQELANKCRQCVDSIQAAKKKQEQEADKAAASLLALLAHEEALEQSKKLTKQRQKEKKRAKKQAKKAQMNEDDEAEQPQQPKDDELKDVNDRDGSEDFAFHIDDDPKLQLDNDTDIQPDQDHLSTETLDMYEKNDDEKNSFICCMLVTDDDLRVPIVTSPSAATSFSSSLTVDPLPNGTGTESSNKRPNILSPGNTNYSLPGHRRRRRGGRGRHRNHDDRTRGGGSSILSSSNPNSLISTKNGSTCAEDAEWLRASKKRASVNSKNPGKRVTNLIERTPIQPDDDPCSGRRFVQVLSIISNAIPRIIGRAGVNINAIREATNAHIEVEKMSKTPREQLTRKITIRGGVDTIKNCVRMIEILVRESDAQVEEIVIRVMSQKSPTPPARPTPLMSLPIGLNPPTTARTNPSPPSQAQATPQHPNVWQQRAAIREKQKNVSIVQSTQVQQQQNQHESSPTINNQVMKKQQPSPPPNPQHNSQPIQTSPIDSDKIQCFENARKEQQVNAPEEPPLVSLKSSQEPTYNDCFSTEELQRKAPGYARPSSTVTTTPNSVPAMQASTTKPVQSSKINPISEIWSPPNVDSEDNGITSDSFVMSPTADEQSNIVGPLNFAFPSKMTDAWISLGSKSSGTLLENPTEEKNDNAWSSTYQETSMTSLFQSIGLNKPESTMDNIPNLWGTTEYSPASMHKWSDFQPTSTTATLRSSSASIVQAQNIPLSQNISNWNIGSGSNQQEQQKIGAYKVRPGLTSTSAAAPGPNSFGQPFPINQQQIYPPQSNVFKPYMDIGGQQVPIGESFRSKQFVSQDFSSGSLSQQHPSYPSYQQSQQKPYGPTTTATMQTYGYYAQPSIQQRPQQQSLIQNQQPQYQPPQQHPASSTNNKLINPPPGFIGQQRSTQQQFAAGNGSSTNSTPFPISVANRAPGSAVGFPNHRTNANHPTTNFYGTQQQQMVQPSINTSDTHHHQMFLAGMIPFCRCSICQFSGKYQQN